MGGEFGVQGLIFNFAFLCDAKCFALMGKFETQPLTALTDIYNFMYPGVRSSLLLLFAVGMVDKMCCEI